MLHLRKLAVHYDATDKSAALAFLEGHNKKGEILTGLLYIEPESEDMVGRLDVSATPLNQLGEAELCPGAGTLELINAELR